MFKNKNQKELNCLLDKAYRKYMMDWFHSLEPILRGEILWMLQMDITVRITAAYKGRAEGIRKAARKLKGFPENPENKYPLDEGGFIKEKLTDDSGYQYGNIGQYLDKDDLCRFQELINAGSGKP